MLQTHRSRDRIKPLMALIAGFGLTTWLVLPIFPAFWQGPQMRGDTAAYSGALASSEVPVDEGTRARVREAYSRRSLSFEANQGQTDEQVKFLTRGSGYTLFLTSSEAVLSLQRSSADTQTREPEVPSPLSSRSTSPEHSAEAPAVVRLQLIGANPEAKVVGVEKRASRSHYLLGRDRQHWHSNVPHYGKVRYEQVYRGVDLVYYGKGQQLEYDFVVAPGADPNVIKLSFAGAEEVGIDEGGELVVSVAGAELRQPRPVVYQEVSGLRKEVASQYVLHPSGASRAASSTPFQVSIAVGHYDVSKELVIDPVLDYSTYLGGSGSDGGEGIAVDGKGNAYITGVTDSSNFPTEEAFQPANAGAFDVFVTKLSRDGTVLDYSTYLGGSNFDLGLGIAVDGKGNAYVTGLTVSSDFPTEEAFQPANAGSFDAFVTKLSRDGAELVYSTYLGGSSADSGESIAVDGKGNAYITGQTISGDFPTEAAFQPANAGSIDAFVTKLSRDGAELVYSTYLGGSGSDSVQGIAVDGKGNAYVTGETLSSDFPTEEAFQPANAGSFDAFVSKIASADKREEKDKKDGRDRKHSR